MGEGKMCFTFLCPAHFPLAKGVGGVAMTLQEMCFPIIAAVEHSCARHCATYIKYIFSFLLTIVR